MKDVFYDYNDILVALIIVLIAIGTIMGNINSILEYPSVLAAQAQLPEEKVPTVYSEQPSDDQRDTTEEDQSQSNLSGEAIDANSSDSGSSGTENIDSSSNTSEKPNEYSVYINTGSTGAQIADILVKLDLFQDRAEFNAAVTAAGAEGKLRAGNFIIPSDATPSEVIAILTK